MREKYFVCQYAQGETIQAALGIRYDPRAAYLSDGRRGPWTGSVLIGGPGKFKEMALTILQAFSSRAVNLDDLERKHSWINSKARWALSGVSPKRWCRGLDVLRDSGFELKQTRTFRRLVW